MILVGKAAATRLRDLCQQYQAWKLNYEGAEKPSWSASALCRNMFRSIERTAGLPIGIRSLTLRGSFAGEKELRG